ncbi:DUF3291 domain-containing protein [Candidatus Rhodobacter oscarellae]|nr:DUF3291 domain-containing protein [Candidatus Rhodobacter lobularis]
MKQPEGHHLAQFNWATLRYDVKDPRVAEFTRNIARMNALAERIPGFIWRHLDDPKQLRRLAHTGTFKRTPRFTTTLSVWRDFEALETFAFKTIHKRFYDKRAEWFEPHEGAYHVLWWVPEGHRPTIPEAVERAEHLLSQGDTAAAFGWRYLSG